MRCYAVSNHYRQKQEIEIKLVLRKNRGSTNMQDHIVRSCLRSEQERAPLILLLKNTREHDRAYKEA